jgi:hypothetical protein
MSLWCRIAGLSPILMMVVLAACGGDGGSGGSDDTATATATATPTLTSTTTAVPTITTLTAIPLTPTESPFPFPSPTLTAPPATTPTPEAPPAPVPRVDPSLEVLTTGAMNVTMGPGDTYSFDPVQLGINEGIEVPPCAAFTFLFGWQVQKPYPPEGVEIAFQWTRMGGGEEVDRGTSGQASVGCGSIEMSNNGAMNTTVQVRYAIAQARG